MVGLTFADIQGNILRGYNFAAGTHYFISVPDPERGRAFLRDVLPRVTDARDWGSRRPVIATNVALTFAGLTALGVDGSVLEALPDAFKEPIRERAPRVLGDNPAEWRDRIGAAEWTDGIGTTDAAHILVLLASSEERQTGDAVAERFPALRKRRVWLHERMAAHGATCVYPPQEVEALGDTQREHFGYRDGFGQPAVEGVPNNRAGQGIPEPDTGAWRDIKAGEFILGYPNEDGELDSGPAAWLLHDGSFMVYRKLEQNVRLFREVVTEHAQLYLDTVGNSKNTQNGRPARDGQGAIDADRMTAQDAFELMAAKLVGRWQDGVAIELEPGPARGDSVQGETATQRDNDFRYTDDPKGYFCPRGAHVRRANPRDLLGADGRESRRHRIIRRGMPYGPRYETLTGAASEAAHPEDDGDRGLIFMCFNADFERQFEVIQGQWCNDGNVFALGDDQDYLLGRKQGKVTIEGEPPLFLRSAPELVVTRGCEYLVMPGLRALHRLSAPPDAYESDLEHVPVGEPEATSRVVELVSETMRRNYALSRPARRGQHPKAHGCVTAKFIVDGNVVPDDLRFGLFAVEKGEPRTYDAWIRFSASHPALQSDAKPDAQGMAIKVMDVKGEKVLPTERCLTTQDFIMVNYDVFFLRDAAEVAEFAGAITATGSVQNEPLLVQLRAFPFFFPPDPRKWKFRGARNLWSILHGKVANPLEFRYWSQTPYALGPHAVKYSVRPLPQNSSAELPADYDALEDALADALKPADGKFSFEFLVQRQADPRTMPVEDPTVRWSERDSPFRRVATIEIAHQDVTTQRRRNFGENLNFTPWHTLWEHRPLGGINRVRRAVYEASSELRHELNGAPSHELDEQLHCAEAAHGAPDANLDGAEAPPREPAGSTSP